jgi:hypothetical protein
VAVKIRLMGLPAEVTTVLQALHDTRALELIEVSDPYPNRGDSRLVRVYIQAQPRAGTPVPSRTWDEVKATLFAGRDEELRAAEEQRRDEICPYCEDPDRWP